MAYQKELTESSVTGTDKTTVLKVRSARERVTLTMMSGDFFSLSHPSVLLYILYDDSDPDDGPGGPT